MRIGKPTRSRSESGQTTIDVEIGTVGMLDRKARIMPGKAGEGKKAVPATCYQCTELNS